MRRFAVLTATAVVGALTVFAPLEPATADVCVDHGTATTSAPLVYPLNPVLTGTTLTLQGSRSMGWSFSTGIGTCLPGLVPFSATGWLHGYCGHGIGIGVDNAGHRVTWNNVGSMLIFT